MNYKILGAFAAVALLSACAKHTTTDQGAITQTQPTAPMPAGIVPGTQEDLVANVGDRVFFDTAKNSLTSDAQKTLAKEADWLAKYPAVKVQLAGNCDERGTEEYNLALGNRRANAARDFLVAKGVSASRITTISYGKDRPVALGSNEQAWAQNRNSITSVR